MKKGWLFILAALLALAVFPALAQDVVFSDAFSVPADAEEIDFGDVQITDFDKLEAFLDQLPNLKKADMFSTPVKAAQADALTERYPAVSFGWTLKIAEHLVRTDATAFSTLHNNKSKGHSSADFACLKYCKNLLALDIGHNSVDDLSFLQDLPNLRVLIVACNKITDISPLARLTDLTYLELFKNKITDLSPLAGLSHLLDLNICFNYVKDYTPLYGLSGLERLWVYNSDNYSAEPPISKDIVSALASSLPDTYIDSTHYSTLGGWRDHPRYDVIYQMFSTGEYIPFPEEE